MGYGERLRGGNVWYFWRCVVSKQPTLGRLYTLGEKN